jgi:Rit1 N-terminal domain
MELMPDAPSVLKSIRNESTDIYNRLHSIYEDSQFVTMIIRQLSQYPVLGVPFSLLDFHKRRLITAESANQRCGAWYIATEIAR